MSDDNNLSKPEPPNKAWMVTFTDLVSLMLTFFVLLFSMSSIKVDEWETMIDSLTQTLNPSRLQSVAAATAQYNISTTFRKRAINLDYLATILDENMKADDFLRRAQLLRLEDRLIIALPGDLLFEQGRSIMTEEARAALFGLGGLMRNIGNQVGVNGHSDSAPPGGDGEYASNWELSMARAIAVANSIKRSGYDEDVIAYGFADSRFSQLPPSIEGDERNRLARRVDIVVLPTVGG